MKKIKHLCFLILFPIVMSMIMTMMNGDFRVKYFQSQYQSFSLENDSLGITQANEVEVVLRYNELTTKTRDCFETSFEYRNFISQIYEPVGKYILESIDLKDCIKSSIYKYGPFIELKYASISILERNDLISIKNWNDENYSILEISINSLAYSTNENSNSTNHILSEEYSVSDIRNDVGIYNDIYTGVGVNVGIIEIYLPSNDDGFGNNLVEAFSASDYFGSSYNATEEAMNHSGCVATIIAGDNGLASGANLYIAALNGSSLQDCFAYMIDIDADVINMSFDILSSFDGNGTTLTNGNYSIYSYFVDYVVYNSGITVVTSLGNTNPNSNYNYCSTFSQCYNALSVGSINRYKNMSNFNQNTRRNSVDSFNVNLYAPGEGVRSFSDEFFDLYNDSGTSFSAPIVSAIVARLFQEYTNLSHKPELINSVLMNSGTKFVGQTNKIDDVHGAGIVNYDKSRTVVRGNSYSFYDNLPSYDSINSCYFLNYSLGIDAYACFSSVVFQVLNVNSLNYLYNQVYVSVVKSNGSIVGNGTQLHNVTYYDYDNTISRLFRTFIMKLTMAPNVAITKIGFVRYYS